MHSLSSISAVERPVPDQGVRRERGRLEERDDYEDKASLRRVLDKHPGRAATH